VHGTGETVKSVVVEQLPVVVAKVVATYLLWAFAGTIDKIATATPATKSDAAFMAISSQIPPFVGGKQLYLRWREEIELIYIPRSVFKQQLDQPQFQTGPIGVRVQQGPKLPPL
jgi:hypothetical protein